MEEIEMKTGKTEGEKKSERERRALAIVAGLAKITFVSYKVFITLMAVITIPLLILLLADFFGFMVYAKYYSIGMYAALIITFIILCKTSKPAKVNDNPYRKYVGFSGWLDSRVDRLIAWFGTLKYFSSPLCMVEDPSSYKIKGHEIRALIEYGSKYKLEPGDILLRGYDGYVDGELIKLSGGAQGKSKYFSHAAIYMGEVTNKVDKDDQKPIAARRLKVLGENGKWRDATDGEKESVRSNTEYFQTGKQMVIHAMAKGVFVEDILTFLRCDYIAVLRLNEMIKLDKDAFDNTELVSLKGSDAAELIRDKLKNGQEIYRSEIVELVCDSALGRIGSCYDFQFTDSKTFNRFSCSEFAYYCYKSIHGYLGLHPTEHGFMRSLFVRKTITPGDIYAAAVNKNKLRVVWQSSGIA